MYGYFNLVIRAFIRERYGEDTWSTIVYRSGCASTYDQHALYDDEASQRLIKAIADVLKADRKSVLLSLGEYYLTYLRQTGHDELLRNLGDNMLAFLENMDYVHTYMMTEYPDLNMPSFRCEAESLRDNMIVHYYSFRRGLYPLVMGILQAVAKAYFKSDLTTEVLNISSEVVSSSGRKLTREHVVFAIAVAKIPSMLDREQEPESAETPPTLIAQTRRQSERQIMKEDVDYVRRRLAQLKRVYGESALPLQQKKGNKARWKVLAKMSVLYGGFIPTFPTSLTIDPNVFCTTFPFHMAFDENMLIVHSGSKMQQIVPQIRQTGSKIDVLFDLLHPHGMEFNFRNISQFINTPFVLRTRSSHVARHWINRPAIVLRGQMMFADNLDHIIYMASPFVRSFEELEERGLNLADIPVHDVTRDLLWMELRARQSKKAIVECPLRRDTTLDPPVPYRVHEAEVDDLNQQLEDVRQELDQERRKHHSLMYSLLPQSTAQIMLKGQKPEVGDYHNVTVLFSDLVAFSQIIERCKPRDVIDLLTVLHSKFNRLCHIHGTFRVESIGDAYMVVCGIPDPLNTHADRIANTALGMMLVAHEIPSPFDYGDGAKTVKIRIGIHSGMVTGGVVGDKVPRYLVMGETVNLASKMESHGDPNKIQITETTYKILRNKCFEMEKRGCIQVRGKGNVTTYFLLRNDQMTDEVILGKRYHGLYGNRVSFINDGHMQEPPYSSSTEGSGSPLLTAGKGALREHPPSRDIPIAKLLPEDDLIPAPYPDNPRGNPTTQIGK